MAKTAVKAGEAYIELGIKNRIDKGMREAEKRLRQRGKQIAAAGALLSAGTAGLLAAPIRAASEMQETLGKFDTVFGSSAAAMRKWAQTTSDAMGITEQSMLGMLSGLQDLLVPMGMAPDAAEGMSKELSKLAVDLASFNNMSPAVVMRDLMAALTGSSETMKKYGSIVDAAAVKQELLNKGLDPKTADAATKAQARYAIIMRTTTAAQGDAVRTSGSFANQTKRLNSILKGTVAALGGPMIDDMASLVGLVNRGAATAKDFVQENKELVRIIGLATLAVGGIGGALLATGATVSAMSFAVSGLGILLGGIITVTGALLSPIGLATAAIVGLGVAFFKFTDAGIVSMDMLQNRFGPLVDAIVGGVQQITDAIAAGGMQAAWETAAELMELVWLELTGEIRDLWGSAMDWIGQAGTTVADKVGQAFEVLATFLDGMLKRYQDYYNNLFDMIADGLTELGGTKVVGGRSKSSNAFSDERRQGISSALKQMEQFGKSMRESARANEEARRQQREAARTAREQRTNQLRGELGGDIVTDRQAKVQSTLMLKRLRELAGGLSVGETTGQKVAKLMGVPATSKGASRSSGTFSAFGAAVAGSGGSKMLTLTQSIEMSSKQQAATLLQIAENIGNSGGADIVKTLAQFGFGGQTVGGLLSEKATGLLANIANHVGVSAKLAKRGANARFQ